MRKRCKNCRSMYEHKYNWSGVVACSKYCAEKILENKDKCMSTSKDFKVLNYIFGTIFIEPSKDSLEFMIKKSSNFRECDESDLTDRIEKSGFEETEDLLKSVLETHGICDYSIKELGHGDYFISTSVCYNSSDGDGIKHYMLETNWC